MWIVYALSLYPHTFKFSRFVPFLFVMYLAMVCASILVASLFVVGIISLPFVLYLLLNSVFSWKSSPSVVVKLKVFVTFFSYHISYGVGTVCGVLNMLTGRWRNYLGRSVKR